MVVKVFYSHSHQKKDETLLETLEKHLLPLKWLKVIDGWHDGKISGGEKWADEIDQHLNNAHLILLLVSPDYLSSPYWETEAMWAIERHKHGEAWVIPIILRAIDWRSTPLGPLQPLPTEGRPVNRWRNVDDAFHDVETGICKAIKGLLMNPRNIFHDTENYRQTLESFEQTYGLESKDSRLYKDKGDKLEKMGQYDEALIAFAQAILADPKFAEAWNAGAIALRNVRGSKHRIHEAIETYEQAFQHRRSS